MAAVAEDQVTKTKVILCHSIADVVQLTLTIFPLFIHHPGRPFIFTHNSVTVRFSGARFNSTHFGGDTKFGDFRIFHFAVLMNS